MHDAGGAEDEVRRRNPGLEPILPGGAVPGQGIHLDQGAVGNDLEVEGNLHPEVDLGLVGGMVLHRQPEMGPVGPVVGEEGAMAAGIGLYHQTVAGHAVVADAGAECVARLLVVRDVNDVILTTIGGAVNPGVLLAINQHAHHAHGGIKGHHHGGIRSQDPHRLHFTHDVGAGVAHGDQDVVADGIVNGLYRVGARRQRALQRDEECEDHSSLRLSVK